MRTASTSRRRDLRALGPLLGCLVVAGASASCATSSIIEVFTTGDLGVDDRRTEFFLGEQVTCQAKVASARAGVRLNYNLRVLEVDGQKGNFGLYFLGSSVQGKSGSTVAPPAQVPASLVQAQLDHPARIVTAPDAVDDPSAVALAQDIFDTLVDHMNDSASHTAGRIDPTLALVQAVGKCNKVSNLATPDSCGASLNALKALFDRHIADATYHAQPDTVHAVTASDATVQDGTNAPPPIPVSQVTTYPLATDFKYKLTGHIYNVRPTPLLVPGRFRCEATFDDDMGSAEFVVVKGFKQKPPADPAVPVQGKCNIDTVAYCPDPNKGPNLLKCCTLDGACGVAPKGIALCNANP